MIPNLPACKVCGTNWQHQANSQVFANAVDSSGSGFEDFTVRTCNGCGIGFTSPIPSPSSASDLYGSRESSNFDSEGGPFVSHVKDVLATSFIGRLAADRKVRRVLDFSTGNGRYALASSRRLSSAAVIATDIQPHAPAALRQAKAVRYVPTSEFWADPSLGEFDLIVMRHVLEHIYDPDVQLATLRDRLAPGGAIYIEVPNRTCVLVRIMGKYFPGFYAPYHVHHFDKRSLLLLLEKLTMTGDVQPGHMPLVGNFISRRWSLNEGFLIKLLGISLFPLQMLAEKIFDRASVIRVIASRRAKDDLRDHLASRKQIAPLPNRSL